MRILPCWLEEFGFGLGMVGTVGLTGVPSVFSLLNRNDHR